MKYKFTPDPSQYVGNYFSAMSKSHSLTKIDSIIIDGKEYSKQDVLNALNIMNEKAVVLTPISSFTLMQKYTRLTSAFHQPAIDSLHYLTEHNGYIIWDGPHAWFTTDFDQITSELDDIQIRGLYNNTYFYNKHSNTVQSRSGIDHLELIK